MKKEADVKAEALYLDRNGEAWSGTDTLKYHFVFPDGLQDALEEMRRDEPFIDAILENAESVEFRPDAQENSDE